jgi:hypothetical protein
MYVLDKSGRLLWTYATGGEIASSACIGEGGVIYFGSRDNRLYALRQDGVRKWHFSTAGDVDSSPALDAGGSVIVGSGDGHLYAVSPDGEEQWSVETGSEIRSSPCIGPSGTVYAGSDEGSLFAVDPDGRLLWSVKTGDWIESSPLAAADGTVFIASASAAEEQTSGVFSAIDSEGRIRWSIRTEAPLFSSPNMAADGTLCFGTDDGRLYALQGDGEGLAAGPWPKFRHDARNSGSVSGNSSSGESAAGPAIPRSPVLLPNYPNPFNSFTKILFGIPQNSAVQVRIYNAAGQTVRLLASGPFAAGWHSLSWDGLDDRGRPVLSGIYLLRLLTDGFECTQKILLIR